MTASFARAALLKLVMLRICYSLPSKQAIITGTNSSFKGAVSSQSEQTFERAWNRRPRFRFTLTKN